MFRLLLTFLAMTTVCQAVVWNEGIVGELHWDESLTIQNYTIILNDFSIEESITPRVLLELQENNQTIARRSMQAGEQFTLNDSIKVNVNEILRGDKDEDPSAKIQVALPAVADLSLILVGDRDQYQGGDDIRLKLWIENVGIIDAENLKITLDSMPAYAYARYRISNVDAGQSWDDKIETHETDPIKINLKAPYFPQPTDLSLRVHAEFEDQDGKACESWGGAVLHISGPLQLHKRVEEVWELQKEYYVINSLRNTGNRTLAVTLSDSAGSGFRSNSSLSWKMNLSCGEMKTESYKIRAEKPGAGLSLPAAEARYDWQEGSYTVRSEKPVVDVFGPKIEAKRSVSPSRIKPGDTVTVNLEFENTGNKRAAVLWEDAIPDGAEIISAANNAAGNIGSVRLSPNETFTSEYQLRCPYPGTVRLSPTLVRYRDVRSDEYQTSTMATEVQVEEPRVEVVVPANVTETAMNETIINETAGNDTEDSDPASENDRGYMPLLLISIVILLSAAISRHF